ncbi:hypothetical protein F0562_002872 [Nyssa sinensis]|uniref:YbaK/aminoacyl-tRNA synthetase-associated domain-containing protein n=1 Tax=Nyssa sinensis TaxID=561372 RepID=A0A5J5BTW3_9ASTE|nr:hypothetical protein F0562_002872 [Nyssa sinensis]
MVQLLVPLVKDRYALAAETELLIHQTETKDSKRGITGISRSSYWSRVICASKVTHPAIPCRFTSPSPIFISYREQGTEEEMGYSKDQLLARLQELQIDFSQYDHPVVLTVEAQAKYVGHVKGALSKNLFLKDKKHRLYIVSALADTKVDLKVLSQRLGLGKGGLRMAPEEALAEILQVPLGCVTPFALVNESARHVSLLLDQGFKTQECCFFHPLTNDMSICCQFHSVANWKWYLHILIL